MRADMAKLLVERPRLGGGVKFQRNADRKWQRLPLDERPRAEAIKERWRQSKVQLKHLNENLAPLCRFLRSRLGRPWDDVYSEICERINRDSAVQLHIWQHLMHFVETDPRKIQRILQRRRYWRNQFYVDPSSGRLIEVGPRETKCIRSSNRHSQPFLTIVEGRCYRRIDGIWYEVELAPIPPHRTSAWDAVLRRDTVQLGRGRLQEVYGRCVYAAKKRQLCKREIKRLRAAIEALADGRAPPGRNAYLSSISKPCPSPTVPTSSHPSTASPAPKATSSAASSSRPSSVAQASACASPASVAA
jgi:hypothetical protein